MDADTPLLRVQVEAVTKPLLHDSRVLWWEAYNEPCEWRHYEAKICTYFEVVTSTMIKQLTYSWVKALQPSQPVISCWNEHNNTFSDILEPHMYSSDFAAWTAAVFAECPSDAGDASLCNRGALVTEAGARWFEGMTGDAGSPLTVLHYLQALRETGAPFVPGVALVCLAWLCILLHVISDQQQLATHTSYHTGAVLLNWQAWELMVGNSNTRWADGPPCRSPSSLTKEPPIPW
eukprot:COSAG02_NODE_1266_length_13539_cov_216.818824_8_plen_234_part_00